MSNKRLFDINSWKLISNQLEVQDKRLQESLTSIGNGYMGMRGNFEEGYSGDHHQGTYLAGVWFPDKTRVGWWKNGYPEYFGKVINAMNFIGVDIYVDGAKIDLNKDKVTDFHLELDMKEGILRRSFILEKGDNQLKFEFERFLSIVSKEVCAIEVKITSLLGSNKVELVPYLDGDVTNEDSNYEEKFWSEISKKVEANKGMLEMKTVDNPFGTPRFTVSASMFNELNNVDVSSYNEKSMYVANNYRNTIQEGETIVLRKYVAITTSRDWEESELNAVSQKIVESAKDKGYEVLKQDHVDAWADRWEKADVQIGGDDEAQQGIRFNIFQLFSTYYGEDARLNVGPKGFTGEKYGGATYWDTEAYIVPMYLAVAEPKVTEQLLQYRHQQLPGAEHNAKQQGLKGALYPMVTFTGVECHNEWEITFEEIHRNGAIAHAIFNYATYTGDETYALNDGLDVLVGISRFWADRVHYSKKTGQYMIHGVTGPNEYENNINNNWYTNTIAAWTLRYTLELLAKAGEDKKNALSIASSELSSWQDIIDKMYYPADEELGVFVQHDTFLDKDLRTVDTLLKEERPLNQKWSWDKILRSCFIKQADVLQGMYFLNHEFSLDEKKRNFAFYEPMTVHESSLSPCVHSILAAEIGMEDKAYEMYQRTARLDLDNYNNDTEDGLHITSMSGSWLAIVHGFAGMRTATGDLSFAPFLPKGWSHYAFTINYRNRLIKVTTTTEEVKLELISGNPLQLQLYDNEITLDKEYIGKNN
ncbi:glycoside hydrolase family 65 protein [Bacillus sp. B1-b2]|uniref:glycoside hydrolase family 65 protein n=1 Tax=Bacillus sp. B1-b2 TaxID=2653201 RepID=UPI0012625001|nr:glycoside hydrolase family 65 protein [Bacillus sp. B1-b2]KAB7670684.1 glycoside hydrolase family 65 protein [Bacillus sp. B1-b2]